jgi:hypothetical protein
LVFRIIIPGKLNVGEEEKCAGEDLKTCKTTSIAFVSGSKNASQPPVQFIKKRSGIPDLYKYFLPV